MCKWRVVVDDAGMAAAITPDSVPTQHHALRSSHEEQLTRVRAFAVHRAEAAEVARTELRKGWQYKDSREVLLREVHQGLIEWRYRLALQAPGRLGTGIALDAERF